MADTRTAEDRVPKHANVESIETLASKISDYRAQGSTGITRRQARNRRNEVPGDRVNIGSRAKGGKQDTQNYDGTRASEKPAELLLPESGPLAAVASTDTHRRDLFSALVEAFRYYQANDKETALSDEVREHEIMNTSRGDTAEETETSRVLSLGEGELVDSGDSDGGVKFPPIADANPGMAPTSLASDDCGRSGIHDGGSISEFSSVSLRTLCDFGAPEMRSASTQTIAKVSWIIIRGIRPEGWPHAAFGRCAITSIMRSHHKLWIT